MTNQNLDKAIETIRELIFEHSPDDIKTRLRIAVTYIRADNEPLPKKVWTDLIQDIYKAELQTTAKKAEDKVIEIAHKPCECGKDHFATPVRSVTGVVTSHCQFARVVPSQSELQESEGEG